MKSIKLLLAVSILALNAVACSDDSSSNNTGNSDIVALIAQCKAGCDKENTANCLDDGETLDTCKAGCDSDLPATPPAACVTAMKTYGDCVMGLADICTRDVACLSQLAAAAIACQ